MPTNYPDTSRSNKLLSPTQAQREAAAPQKPVSTLAPQKLVSTPTPQKLVSTSTPQKLVSAVAPKRIAAPGSHYLLYSHYKALDQVQEMGFIPLRLFRVLYPLWRVRVDGQQRVNTEFDELEWYIERGLLEAGFISVAELAAFFGLEQVFVQRLVNFSRGIRHISGDDTHLTLTDLGIASVKDRVRYEDQKVSAELYFDALGSAPLTAEHNKIPILETLPPAGETPYQAFTHFGRNCDEDENPFHQRLTGPEKQHFDPGFNLPDRITGSQLLNREPVYMPAYFIEVCEKEPAISSPREHRDDGANRPVSLLVFSQVRGLHDTALEEAVNRDPTVYRALKAKTDSRAESVRRYFEKSGLKKDTWYLNENGPWGAQVMVDGQVFAKRPDSDIDEEESGRLSMRSVGRYSLIYDWCIWVMCDDLNVRKQAAAEQLLEWLQNANTKPPQQEIKRKFANLRERLNIQDQGKNSQSAVQAVLTLARKKGFARAAERLEELDEDGIDPLRFA